jgi:hypothetical protein
LSSSLLTEFSTERGSSVWALILLQCLLCYLGGTLFSQCLEPPSRAG